MEETPRHSDEARMAMSDTPNEQGLRSVARHVRALLGVPDPRDLQASAWVSTALIGVLLQVLWLLSVAVGGSSVVPPHWFYLPIGIAAARFGHVGAVVTAVASGIVAGPLLPADVAQGEPQVFSDWASRTAFFVAVGSFLAWLVNLYRGATDELRSSKAVAAALMGTVDPSSPDQAIGREQVEEALRPGAFTIVLQPIVDLHDGSSVGFEALARFPASPYRPPNEWFSAAWSVGLGIDLEVAAFRAAVELLPVVPQGFLSVNLSPATVTSPAFQNAIRQQASDRLVLEMTEHIPVSDYGILREALRASGKKG
jgi:EAL domain